MKNPYFAERSPFYVPGEKESVSQMLARTGGNTGNFMFIHALRRVVKHCGQRTKDRFIPAKIREQYDGILIPAANWLNPRSDFGGFASNIENTSLPCVVVGIGAQSDSFNDIPILTKGTKRFLSVVSERSASISVRGEYTAHVLQHYGIKNVSITGCPSMLWKVSQPVRMEHTESAYEKVSVCGTRRPGEMLKHRNRSIRLSVSLDVARIAFERGYDYVAQTELDDIKLALRRFDCSDDHRKTLTYLREVYGAGSAEEIERYGVKHIKVFFNVIEWMRYLRSRDIIVGTRLHGVVAAIISGTPGILISHDTRTAESAKQLGLPVISGTNFHSNMLANPKEMAKYIDIEAFNQRMSDYYKNFVEFFSSNNIENNLKSDS